jgi:NAD(P)-dependent dehydrogenase (short-subunit alcohol dehydrogenase family)
MMGHATLITGASRGIGRALAERLAGRGETVIGLARRNPDNGFPGDFFEVDLADADQTREAATEIAARYSVDRLVNNAGYLVPATLAETERADYELQTDVNLRASLLCVQACLPVMREKQFGRIVNIATRAVLGRVKRTAYAAAKLGLIGATRVWALELAPFGITVNTVAPGPIATEMFKTNMPVGSDEYNRVIAGIPLGRMGTPEEVASAIGYFLDDDAAFVTGQTLFVCGGGSIG